MELFHVSDTEVNSYDFTMCLSIHMFAYNILLFHDSTYHTAHGTPGSYSGGGGGIRLQEIRIEFERGGKGLGLSIAGGLGSTPYKLNDEGIFISRVTPGGPAHVAGLCKDDKVRLVTS